MEGMTSTDDARREPPAWALGLAGLLSLAVAMGIGRFAFTPLLPLMQEEGLALADGGRLASSNYAGYLHGALSCVFANPNPGGSPARARRAGVTLFVLVMVLTAD